jgi:hypothetical protein
MVIVVVVTLQLPAKMHAHHRLYLKSLAMSSRARPPTLAAAAASPYRWRDILDQFNILKTAPPQVLGSITKAKILILHSALRL